MRKPYETPEENCPYCKTLCEADWFDNGIGMQQAGPYHCESCNASEIGPFDKERPLTPEEKETGWYAPSSPAGSSANVIDGKIVSHTEMKERYAASYPFSASDDWWEEIRKPK